MRGAEDTALIAGQLADLTHAVEKMAKQFEALRDRADSQQERADTQQERIDLAAQELCRGQRAFASCCQRTPGIGLS
jgi:hypothetical protein